VFVWQRYNVLLQIYRALSWIHRVSCGYIGANS